MISPSVMALQGASFTLAALMVGAAAFGVRILRHWDITSGSERQLRLERQTYLISTVVAYSFMAEILALLLFVYTAEQLSSQFVGAMCATGVLNVNGFGWPTLWAKMAVGFAGFAWLTLDALDQRAPDYPLVRRKYALLIAIAPLVVLEAGSQAAFFAGLKPDVITSCCGALFTPEGRGVAAEVAAVPPRYAAILFYASGAALAATGGYFLWRARGARLFALVGVSTFLIAVVAIVSFIALYVYEHPHHHCPFCLLKAGHGYVGYALYLPLFTATAFALGTGLVAPWRRIPTLAEAAPRLARHYAWLALAAFTVFFAVATLAVLRSNLTMEGVWW